MDELDEFERYVTHLCGVLGHADRRAGMRGYCSGLMAPIKRKSIEPMACKRSAITSCNPTSRVYSEKLRESQKARQGLQAATSGEAGSTRDWHSSRRAAARRHPSSKPKGHAH